MKKNSKSDKVVETTVRLARKRVIFTVKTRPGACVFLAGSFNDWNTTDKEMKDKNGDGVFTVMCFLPAGTYEYKYCIDGVWCTDTANPNVVSTPLNTLNSVLEVK